MAHDPKGACFDGGSPNLEWYPMLGIDLAYDSDVTEGNTGREMRNEPSFVPARANEHNIKLSGRSTRPLDLMQKHSSAAAPFKGRCPTTAADPLLANLEQQRVVTVEFAAVRRQREVLQQREAQLHSQLLGLSQKHATLLGVHKPPLATIGGSNVATSVARPIGLTMSSYTAPQNDSSGVASSSLGPVVGRNSQLATISFEQLEHYTANIGHYWDRKSKETKCPCCRQTLKVTLKLDFIRHLATHLADKSVYPFHCPLATCSYTSLRMNCIKKHVSTHNLGWTDDMDTRSVDVEKMNRFRALYRSV